MPSRKTISMNFVEKMQLNIVKKRIESIEKTRLLTEMMQHKD